MRTKQSVCHEIPLGSAATKSSGHSSRVVSHGRNASSGPAAQHCYSSTNQRTTLTWQVVKHSRSGLTHLTAQLLRSPMTAGLPRTLTDSFMSAVIKGSLKPSNPAGVSNYDCFSSRATWVAMDCVRPGKAPACGFSDLTVKRIVERV